MQDHFPVDYSHLSTIAIAKKISVDYGLDWLEDEYFDGGLKT